MLNLYNSLWKRVGLKSTNLQTLIHTFIGCERTCLTVLYAKFQGDKPKHTYLFADFLDLVDKVAIQLQLGIL